MLDKLPITAVVITHNEAHNIKACLESLFFAEEVIVLDSGSTDNTVAIAQQYTDRVIQTDWPGDGPQRNRGIEQAQQEWILCLDADERITPELTQELYQLFSKPLEHAAYRIPFQSHYLGKPIRYGDWWGERHIRLFRKDKARYTSSSIYGAQGAHCRLEVDGTIGALKNNIIHYPFPNFEVVLKKLNDYSTGSAAIRVQRNQKGSLGTALFHGAWAFVRGYVMKLGFLDGKCGFILAVSNAEGTYYRYLKMSLLKEASLSK
ncbi:MAG: glycosyltransferase family 2 protein [Pseudomonadota bacterium]